jgi:hypothetical protein
LFHRFETALQVLSPAVIHQIAVRGHALKVDSERAVYEGEVETAAVICIKMCYFVYRFQQVIGGSVIADQLNQPAAAAVNKVDAYNRYI